MQKTLSALFLIMILGLVSCQNPASGGGTSPAAPALTIHIGAPADRTVAADWSSAIKSYYVTITCPGETTQDLTVNTGTPVSFAQVPPGTWTVGITAFSGSNKTGNQVAAGSTTCRITAGGTQNVSLSLSATQTATGSYAFTVLFPSASAASVSAELYAAGNTSSVLNTLNPSPTTSGANYQAVLAQTNLASGAYLLKLKFYKGSSLVGTFFESLNVWDNVTSDQWVDSSGTLQANRTFAASELASTDATLASLTYTGTFVTAPASYSAATTTYNCTASSPVTVTATLNTSGQGLQYQVNGSGAWTPLASGTSVVVPTISSLLVKVTAPDGQDTTVYRVNVNGYFSYTGAEQTWTVPLGVTAAQFTAVGATGAGGTYGGAGGLTTAAFGVTAGTSFSLYVGGEGASHSGYNGGGYAVASSFYGGGATDVRLSGTRILVAGGGGGYGANNAGGSSIQGGYGAGVPNTPGGSGGSGSTGIGGGGGGTLLTGGTGGAGVYLGSSGSSFNGGSGGLNNPAGGGGGGYYGGGGGGAKTGSYAQGAGGGGSSFVSDTAASSSGTSGYNSSGDGWIIIANASVY